MPSRALLLAAAVATVLASPASGAPRACNLLTDPRNDESGGLRDSALDLVGADVASDRRDFTVAIRLADLVTPAPTSPAGVDYTLQVRIGETTLEFRTALSATKPPRYALRRLGGASAPGLSVVTASPVTADVRGVVDVARDEVRMTVPLRALAAFGARHDRSLATDLVAFTWRTVPLEVDTFVVSADHAAGSRPYRLGTPSCLAVGR